MGSFSCEVFNKDGPFVVEIEEKNASSQLESVETHPDKWMTELESLRNEIDKISISTKMSDEDFMIRVLTS